MPEDTNETKFQRVLEMFAERRDRLVIGLVAGEAFLTDNWAMLLRHHLQDYNDLPSIDIVVDSIGGDVGAAYSVVELLRTHAKSFTAVVPRFAMSAATLICMGADEILVDECSKLGPLDAQIPQNKGGGYDFSSALSPFSALEQLREFTLESQDLVMKLIMNRTTMTPHEAMNHASNLVEAMTRPLFSQLDPEKLGEYSRALVVAKEYATRLLSRYSKLSPIAQQRLIEKMVYDYPSHDFIIDYTEMVELELPVVLAPSDERGLLRSLFYILQQGNIENRFYIANPPRPVPPPSPKPTGRESGGRNARVQPGSNGAATRSNVKRTTLKS